MEMWAEKFMTWVVVGLGVCAWGMRVRAQELTESETTGLDRSVQQAEESGGESREGDRADGESSIEGMVRLGGEWDTNAGRVAPVGAAVSDGLMRYFLSLEGEVYDDGRTRMRLDLRQGGKAFAARQSNNTLLTSLDIGLSHRLDDVSRRASSEGTSGAAPTRWWWVFDARLKDRIEQESKQDYSRGSLRTGIRMRRGSVAVRATGGWGFFAFRPNPAATSQGPRGSLQGTVWLGKRWYLQPSYTLAWRLFQSTRFLLRTNVQGEEVPQRDRSGQDRRDVLHVGRFSVGYRGDFVLRSTAELLVNRSNSYGQRLVRYGAILDATVPLPWRLYASGRLELQRTDYEDPIFVGRDFTVDENNRNAAILSLSRSFGEHWDLEARWRGFIEEFGARADYRRQTVSMSVGYGW
jgi:hypothetical protein